MGIFNIIHTINEQDENDLEQDVKEFNALFDTLSFDDLETYDPEDEPEEIVHRENVIVSSRTEQQGNAESIQNEYSEPVYPDDTPRQHSTTETLEQGEKTEINLAVVWNNKGVVLSKLGRYAEAIDAYNQALVLNPDYVNAWNNKGVALSKLKNYTDAIDAFDQALQSAPGYQPTYEPHEMTEVKVPSVV